MEPIRRNIFANYVARGWTAILGIIVPPIYVRLLGIESYGLVGFFSSLSTMLSLLDLGLNTTLQREIALLSAKGEGASSRRTLLRTFEVTFWTTGCLAGVGVYGVAPWIVRRWIHLQSLDADNVTTAVRVMGLVFAVQWAGTAYNGALMGMQKQVAANAVALFGTTARSLGGLLVVLCISRTILGFFVAQACAVALQTLCGAVVAWRSVGSSREPARFDMARLNASWRFSAGAWGISVLGILISQTDKLLVSKLLTLSALGYYTLAGTAAASLYYLVTPVVSAVFPRLCQLSEGAEHERELSRLYHRSTQLLSVLVLPVGATLIVFAPDALVGWTGNALVAKSASTTLVLLTLGTALNGLVNLPYALQLAHAWTRLTFLANMVVLATMVPTAWLLGTRYGASGIAFTWVLVNAGYVLVLVPLMHRRLLRGEAWQWYRDDLLKPLVPAVATVVGLRLMISAPTGRISAALMVAAVAVVAVAAAAMSTPWLRDLATHRLLRRVTSP